MDGFMPMTGFYGFGMFFWWLIFLAIGYLVYQDAEKRGMNGLLWFILVILPMVGFLFLILYLVMREERPATGKRALEILDERYARGEINREEYLRMKKELEGGE
ncbi:SHOCT domain-containing protein [Archaeoglobus veneficus]|uniref:SHOCT domain-containing protein n=1 Tax=Archaeoglobus veneficus (strain DSM 11195 / SNP6) TaxID=693661 RepID=F2KT84_ARCVS|nr:SHOCT domain-containing protein [Archaeoglobus veneficus]AEA47114.1 Protein of unknown function DUF2078, membrane [Archaeoglobus veneficus SNP6]